MEKVSYVIEQLTSNPFYCTGAFGEVHKCMHKKTREVRAVKIIDKDRMDEQERVRLQYEVEILKNLYHANIVKLHEVYESPTTIFIVTELCEGKELFEEITSRKKFNEKEAAIVTK